MKSIFAFDIMKNISNTPFSWNNYSLFIILIIILPFNSLRPYKERKHPTFFSLITITTTCPNLGYFSNFQILYPIRTVLFYQFF